jgi:hypothetical protein
VLFNNAESVMEKNFKVIKEIIRCNIPSDLKDGCAKLINDDVKLSMLLGMAYPFLPIFIKPFVKKELFVQFCLRKKHLLFQEALSKEATL